MNSQRQKPVEKFKPKFHVLNIWTPQVMKARCIARARTIEALMRFLDGVAPFLKTEYRGWIFSQAWNE